MRYLLLTALLLVMILNESQSGIIKCKNHKGIITFTDSIGKCKDGGNKYFIINKKRHISEESIEKFRVISQFSENILGFDMELISNAIQTAANEWGRYLKKSADIEIRVVIVDDKDHMMQAFSKNSVYSHTFRNKKYYHKGVNSEFLTGVDPNGKIHDAEILIDRHSLTSKLLWFEADGGGKHISVPKGKFDAISMLTHELGHILCFGGHLNINTKLSNDVYGGLSTYDSNVVFIGDKPYFSGESAVKLHGSMLPLNTKNNVYSHLSIYDRKSGIPIMSEAAIKRGKRYHITNLDLAVLEDCRVELSHKIIIDTNN